MTNLLVGSSGRLAGAINVSQPLSLCHSQRLKRAKKSREITQNLKIAVWNAVRVKMHDVVANLPYFFQQSNESIAVNLDPKTGPPFRLLKEALVLAKGQVCCGFNCSGGVARIL